MPPSSEERTKPIADADGAGSRVVALWDGGSCARPLAPGETLSVGRSLDCDVAIDHPSVSRKHALIHAGPPLSVEDLGSANGTRVGGASLAPGSSARLAAGALIELGAAVVVVHATSNDGPRAQVATAAEEAPMVRLHRLIALVAPTAISVILDGETGSGKEVAAEAIHRASPRAAQPLLRLNCAAFPEPLLESELFGYERGAFSGAQHAKIGLLESAERGTVFLDEIGEMPLGMQAKLLRTIETREVTRLGSVKAKQIDVRFIAASHRDLQALSSTGAFRQDLYFRLNGLTLHVPALRERPNDILPLANEFRIRAAQQMGRAPSAFTSAATATLERYAWPGNVRELRSVVERAVLLAEGDEIDVKHLELQVAVGAPRTNTMAPPVPAAAPEPRSVGALRAEIAAAERQRVLDALAASGGNQTRAAQLLGISRRTLLHRLDEYGVPRPRRG